MRSDLLKPLLRLRARLARAGHVTLFVTLAAGARVGRGLAAAARWTHRNAIDVALVGGYAAIAAGCALIYGPAGLIVGGVLSAGTALMVARSSDPLDDAETPPRAARRGLDEDDD